jgi:hypothetical protein
MIEKYTIYPEYDKIKGLSPLWINECESIDILKTDYDQIVKFIQETRITDKVDNICYIFLLLLEEKISFDLNNELTNYDAILEEDLIQVSKYLQIRDRYQDCVISKINFDIRNKQKNIPIKNKNTYLKEENFYIQNPRIIAEVLKTVLSIYKIKSSSKKNVKDIIKNLKSINKQTILRKKLAHNLYIYLQHSGLGENNKYYAIGFLFQLSGLENRLSEIDYSYTVNHTHKSSYKSYPDFITSHIRNKYFKEHRKASKRS